MVHLMGKKLPGGRTDTLAFPRWEKVKNSLSLCLLVFPLLLCSTLPFSPVFQICPHRLQSIASLGPKKKSDTIVRVCGVSSKPRVVKRRNSQRFLICFQSFLNDGQDLARHQCHMPCYPMLMKCIKKNKSLYLQYRQRHYQPNHTGHNGSTPRLSAFASLGPMTGEGDGTLHS